MTFAVIIQARMGSSRLPGKSLAPLGESTVLDWVVDRALVAASGGHVVVATTTDHDDDPIEDRMSERQVNVVRGDALDVLDRYRAAMDTVPDASVIVRLTADCPLIEPRLIEQSVQMLVAEQDLDYVSTSLDGRYPRGLDVEAVRRSVLFEAAEMAQDQAEREHVTLFVYRRDDVYRCAPISTCPELHRPDLRITVDEPDDLELVRRVVDGTGSTSQQLKSAQVIEFLDANPDIAGLNRRVRHNNVS